MSNADVALTAHLMRRAGFGTTLTELEEYVKKGYENVVEDLVDIERCPPIDEDVVDRYFGASEGGYRTTWMYRMLNSPRPLEEKNGAFLAPCICYRCREKSAYPCLFHAD